MRSLRSAHKDRVASGLARNRIHLNALRADGTKVRRRMKCGFKCNFSCRIDVTGDVDALCRAVVTTTFGYDEPATCRNGISSVINYYWAL